MADQRPDGTLTWFDDDEPGRRGQPVAAGLEPGGPADFPDRGGAAPADAPRAQSLAARADNSIAVVRRAIPIRVLSGASKVAGKPVVIQVARSEAVLQQTVSDLMLTLLLGLPLGVAAAGVGGYSLARRALAPIDRMAERARMITAERLAIGCRSTTRTTSSAGWPRVFNDTLGRLESSFEQMRRFTADVSHELRTPLTAIRSVGEVALREPPRRHRPIAPSSAACSRKSIGSPVWSIGCWRCRAPKPVRRSSRCETIDLRDLAEELVAHLASSPKKNSRR